MYIFNSIIFIFKPNIQLCSSWIWINQNIRNKLRLWSPHGLRSSLKLKIKAERTKSANRDSWPSTSSDIRVNNSTWIVSIYLLLTIIDIAVNYKAESIIKNSQTGTLNTFYTADNKFKLPTEAAMHTKAMKMHAIKLWNLKSFANPFVSKQNRNKRNSNVQRFGKALQALKSIERNKRACDISNLSIS